MNVPPTLVLLNGGLSRRMGRDKASIEVGGRPLGRRPADALAGVVGDVVVAGRAVPGLEARVVTDAVAAAGPLAGLVAGLEAATTDLAVAVACDMPWVEAGLVRLLCERAVGRPDVALVVCQGERGLEPFPSVLRAAAAAPLRTALESGVRALRDAFASLSTAVVGIDEWRVADPTGRSFVNWNRPEDVVP